MLAYAANRPAAGKGQSSPNTLLVVISAHVAVVAAVMSVKMDLPRHIKEPPTIVDFFADPTPPAPQPEPQRAPQPGTFKPTLDHPAPQVPLPAFDSVPVDPTGPTVDVGPSAGGNSTVIPDIPKPIVTPIHRGALLLTSAWELKPPYPASKLLGEEEAVLTLRLSIDERGRVVAVDPVGRADGEFLAAARRHLIAHWRYAPATDDGRAVGSTTTITLRFQLDG
jgi:periplasmic protein TonB